MTGFWSTNGPAEPSADSRMAARGLRDYFNALTLEGFTENQALIICGQLLAAAAISNGMGDRE